MELPIVAPAPVVTDHAAVFRDLFDNQCQFRHFQHYLTGLIVLPNKSLANMARCILESTDKTNLSRFLSEAPWREDAINHRRIRVMLQQTTPHRRRRRESLIVIDDTLCEHVGSLFDYVDRHDNHGDGTYPLAHNPVTSFYVSGPVRFPLNLRLYRRYEELTQWEAAVAQHVPDLKIPPDKKGRNRLHKEVDPLLLQDPTFRARHEQCRTKIALAIELVEAAIRHKVPCGVVVFDAWSLAEDVVQVWARRRKDGISLLKKHRLLEPASCPLREAHGWARPRPGPPSAVEALVPLIPAQAYRPVPVSEHTSWCCTLAGRIPGLGKVRLVVSCEPASVTGRAVVLVTHRADGSTAQSLGLYRHRWPPATLEQDRKGPVGCTAYRLRSAEAMGNHGCVVFVAYALWPLTCLPARPERTQGRSHTRGDAWRQQGRALVQPLLGCVHDPWSQGGTVDQVFAR
jgi:hypothetical protein